MSDRDLAARLAWHRNLNVAAIGLTALLLGAWIGNQGTAPPDVLRVKGLIVEDSLDRARIVIGAPMPLDDTEANAGGEGIAILSPEGRFRVAIGAPTPSPVIAGEVAERGPGDSAGMIIYDGDGDERGGMGTFADGRANVCLDYADGRREAVCMFVYPNDQFAGVVVNGPPDHGYERANLIVGADGLAQVKISSVSGHERAILRTQGSAPAQLLVYDSIADDFVDVMPRPGSTSKR